MEPSGESKSMSGSYSMKGTPAGGTGVKKGSLTTNGTGPPPLSYPADPPDDENMNEIIDENVDLTVFLPDGSQKHQTVEANIPMMDLLINLAASNKLNPAGHNLVVLTGDKWKQIDFKANKTIGVLAGEDRQVSVQIVKKKVEDKVKAKTATQPFEMTYRFTVNLPHNQKKVLRISPKLTLGEVRQQLCKEKNFDQSNFVFLLPGNPKESLDDSTAVGDLKSSEITFASVAMIDAATSKSMPDLAYAAARASNDTREKKDDTGFMPTSGEKKAKRGFLSFLGKKDKKFKVQQDTDIEVNYRGRPKKAESFNVGATKNTENARPVTMYADSGELEHFNMRRTTGNLHQFSDKSEFRKSTGSSLVPVNENVVLSTKSDNSQQGTSASASQNNKLSEPSGAPPKKSAKKRAAPLPPQMNKPKTVQVEIDVHSQSSEQTRIEDLPNERVQLKKVHSRNSSDSSGYHELTVSGAESPDANKGDNLQTTLDTTSIDSVEQFNGDSGIRISPVNRRSASKVAASSRDSSIDIDKPIAPGRKKKRAPLPPPGMSASSVECSPEQETIDSNQDQAEEFEALQAMEEVTMKFNIEDSDDDMQMVETSSVHSEDIDIDAPHRQQPPTFIAPPPPSEPPPDDTEPVDLNMVVRRVDTIDIGVGEDTTSLGPDSAKSSPITISSRRHSISSNSSVNTIEDLSLAFRETIEAGEEALGLESDNDSVQEELTRSMPEFKEKISKLAYDDDSEEVSARSKNSEKAVDSDDSFIVHDEENVKDNEKEKDNYQASLRLAEGNRESSEITYDFTVETVPADFRNLENKEADEDSDESFIVEEVEYLPAVPCVLELDSPRKIPDLDSPKEHKILSLPVNDLHTELPLVESTPKPSAGSRNTHVETEEKVPDKPKEKEEFVISLDELSNVDFSATLPEDQRKEKRRSTEAPKVNYRIAFRSSRDFDEEDVIVEAIPAKVIQSEPVSNDYVDGTEDSDEGVKTKCSELSFSPENEHEDEHLMEEKSISMIALPAERTPVKNTQNTDDGAPDDSFTSSTKITLLQGSSQSPSSNMDQTSPRKDDSFDSSSLMQDQYNQLQQQFSTWQNQLIQNQKLLATQGSPDFSSASQMGGKDDQSNLQLQQLQLQIQMQQQMMLQLQQNMQALALQNTLASQQQTFPQPVSQPLVTMGAVQTQQTPPPPSTQILTREYEKARPESPIQSSSGAQSQTFSPPPAPAAPASVASSKPKPSKADAKYTKPKQRRIERQLDPRETLMLDIRTFGKTHLKKVPVKATHWHK